MSNLINNRRISLVESRQDFWGAKIEVNKEVWASLPFRESHAVIQDLLRILTEIDTLMENAIDILQAKKERENETETETKTETETPIWSAETPAEYANRKKSRSPQSPEADKQP